MDESRGRVESIGGVVVVVIEVDCCVGEGGSGS